MLLYVAAIDPAKQIVRICFCRTNQDMHDAREREEKGRAGGGSGEKRYRIVVCLCELLFCRVPTPPVLQRRAESDESAVTDS